MAEKILGSSVRPDGAWEGEQPYPAGVTPGPWESDGQAVFASDGTMLAESWEGTDEDMALMAAATALYAQLEDARVTLGAVAQALCGEYPSLANNVINQCAIRCADALAKASPAAQPIRQDAGSVTDETDTTTPTPLVTDEPEG